MPDREKVIKGLECMAFEDKVCRSDCPYFTPKQLCVEMMARDALALLREQKKPKRESKAMLPCKCGGKRREHWYSQEKGEGLKCERCGFEVWGKNATDVIRKWNEAVKRDA